MTFSSPWTFVVAPSWRPSHSCLDRWHETSFSERDPRQNAAFERREICPICNEATPTRRKPSRSRRSLHEVRSVEASWAGSYPATGNSPSSKPESRRSIGLRFLAPRSNISHQVVTGQDMLPPPPPPPYPPKTRHPGGTPGGVPLTPVEAAPRAAKMGNGVRVSRRVIPAIVPGHSRSVGVDSAREEAQREATFRLTSMQSQYPAFFNDRTADRRLSKDCSSRRDPQLARIRQPNTRSGLGDDHHMRLGKGIGWVSNRSHDSSSRGASSKKKSYGGGSSSSATGGGW